MDLDEVVRLSKDDPTFFSKRTKKIISAIKFDEPNTNGLLRDYSDEVKFDLGDGPLAGLYYVVKDNIACLNQPVTLGVNPPFLALSNKSASAINIIDSLGAILVGSANLDPLALGSSGENKFYGSVINSAQPDLITGGSSSGCAALVSAGQCDFAIGSDHGGSVRFPAACCKISGIKLSPRFLPNDGSILLDTALDSLGLMATSARNLSYLLRNLSSRSSTKIEKLVIPSKDELFSLDKKSHNDFELLIESLSTHYEIIRINDPVGFKEASEIRKSIIVKEFARFVAKYALKESQLHDEARALVALDKMKGHEQNMDSQILDLKTRVSRILEDNNTAILTPSIPSISLEIPFETTTDISYYFSLANVCELPAIVFGSPKLGSIRSLQLISGTGSDVSLALLASQLEKTI